MVVIISYSHEINALKMRLFAKLNEVLNTL